MTASRREFALSLAALPAAFAITGVHGSASAAELRAAVGEERRRRGLPALAVLVGRQGTLLEQTAVGLRARDADANVSDQDRWHIGSCAKAMTATLIARFVERGSLHWDSTLVELLPEFAAGMDSAAGRITLYQLLTMTAGLPANPTDIAGDDGLVGGVRLVVSGNDYLIGRLRSIEALAGNDLERRRIVAERILADPPRWAPGSRFGYSNTAYVILGAIAEAAGGAPYEQLIADEVFQPLQIGGFGFGAPGSDDLLDQPRGHEARRNGAPVSPHSVDADLPSFLRPAGGIHITLADWSRFVFDHLSGENGEGALLARDTYMRLHAPAPGSDQPYACGWGAPMRRGRRALTHLGNNTLWTAGVSAYPDTGYVILQVSNDGRASQAQSAFESVEEELAQTYPDM